MDTIFDYSIQSPIELTFGHTISLQNLVLYRYMLSMYQFFQVPKYIQMCLMVNLEEFICYTTDVSLRNYILFILLHCLLQYQYIIDIAAADYFDKKLRFQLNYQLVSAYTNSRIRIKCWLSETSKISSISTSYTGANWYERENLDFFGIGFVENRDLRRLLTDYAFEGYPLKKDFPLSGFVEVRYNEFIKRLDYVPIKLIQEFKLFELLSPWAHLFEYKYTDLFHLYKTRKNIPIHLEYLYAERGKDA